MSRPTDRWFPLHVGPFLAGVQDLSRAEIGAYVLLLSFQWTTGRPLPADEQSLANITRCATLDEWRASAPRLLAKFRRVADGWLHLDMAQEQHRAERVSASRSASGQRGAAVRWTHSHAGEPYLPGFEPVDNFAAPKAAESTAPTVELHNGAAETAGNMAKHGKRVRDASQNDAPVHRHLQDLFDRHARRTSRAHALEARAHVCASRAHASAREAAAAADQVAALLAAREAMRQEGVRVSASDPMLVELVAAGVRVEEFADVAREAAQAIERGRAITSPAGWALHTLAHRRQAAHSVPPGPPLDWHATRATMDARARALGLEAWDDYERAQAQRGVMPRHAEWLRALEIADAAAARAQLRASTEEASP